MHSIIERPVKYNISMYRQNTYSYDGARNSRQTAVIALKGMTTAVYKLNRYAQNRFVLAKNVKSQTQIWRRG